ncbi:MAG: crossover junction endodeoxyribonuclease RuvC [Aeromonadaceae bacterium]
MKTISFDQATRETGYAVFVDGELTFSGVLRAESLLGMLDVITELLTRERPEKVVLEDIQYQNNQHTYKILAQLQGALLFILHRRSIEAVVLAPSTWRSIMGIGGRKRAEQKQAAVDYFDEKFAADEAEAILIGLAEEKRNGL